MTGTGTEADPYVITTLTDLQNMNNDLDAYYVLANDIDASGTAAWDGGAGFVPIGSSVAPFQGHFDGKGYTVTGLTINRPLVDDVGLFGNVEPNATPVVIQNITLASVAITGDDGVGALVGEAWDDVNKKGFTISGCHSSGAVTGDIGVGGLIGYAYLQPIDTITSCSSSCAVTGTREVGGLVGDAYEMSFSICSASGVATAENRTGGFAGDLGYCVAEKCFATGNVTATDQWVGGFVGLLYGYSATELATIRDCYARGSATDSGTGTAGGFAGYVQADSACINCYSTGAPSGAVNQGGFVGLDEGGVYVACCWDTDTSGEADACGSGAVSGVTGYTTTEMKDGTATEGWSPVDWDLITASNNGYACLLGITPGCIAPTTPNTIGDRTVVIEKPLLELIRNVEVQLDGRFYIDKDGNAVYESRFHRSG